MTLNLRLSFALDEWTSKNNYAASPILLEQQKIPLSSNQHALNRLINKSRPTLSMCWQQKMAQLSIDQRQHAKDFAMLVLSGH